VTSASALAEAGVSGRETEVLGLLGEHLSHAEIAARLFISVRTVESHVASLRRKLCVGTHRELVRMAAGYRAAVTGPGLAAPPQLPAPLTSFVGRGGERAALAAALGASRLVSAVGPGGIGKTRLAIAVAADVADRFGGTWYVDLVPVTDPGLLSAAMLACLGVDESSSRLAEDVLAAAVGERRALLVLDNCEHLVNAVAVLTERLLSACPNLSVLVTSRIRLVVPHETVYPVPGLSVPPPGGEGGDAATLFAERAAAAGAPLPAGPAGTEDVTGSAAHRAAGICRALGGMPLAIELAAARLPSLGLDGLEAGLADQLSLLSGGARQQQRHRSLQDTLDWSYRLLDPREQAVLRRMAVFAAPFGFAAATVVVGYDPVEPAGVADALGRLAEHSLLVPVASAGVCATTPWNRFASSPRPGSTPRPRAMATAVPAATRAPAAGTWAGA
jgi:predicted ATPase/DNA-binding CsgD family transcriptional regulator